MKRRAWPLCHDARSYTIRIGRQAIEHILQKMNGIGPAHTGQTERHLLARFDIERTVEPD